jgi:hypothetical protein
VTPIESNVRIAVVRTWREGGTVKVSVLFQSRGGPVRSAFRSPGDAAAAIRAWLSQAPAEETPADPSDS